MTTISILRSAARPLPQAHRRNFHHLYLDIAWFGVLSGSAISFMAVFATRLGAAGWQIGLLSAIPAIVSLAVTLPASQWLQQRPLTTSVFWTAVLHRLFYVPWLFLPLLLAPQLQIWALLALVLLMSIPGTALAVGFNAMFAAAVPQEWRGHVVGKRNALLAATFITTSLLCGFLLDWLPFPIGYQVVFAIGVLGAALSSLHLWYVRLPSEAPYRPRQARSLHDLARPGILRPAGDGLRPLVAGRFLTLRRWSFRSWWGDIDRAFGRIVLILFFFHLVQHLAIPLFPLFWVNRLHLSDQHISMGNAVFYVAVLLGSTQLARLTDRLGNHALFAVGVVGMSFYPLLTALTQDVSLFLVTALVGGFAWAMVGGASANYILERIPEEKRPSYLAWYNLSLNAAVLLGSLCGPLLAGVLGLAATLLLSAAGRLVAALVIWRWG